MVSGSRGSDMYSRYDGSIDANNVSHELSLPMLLKHLRYPLLQALKRKADSLDPAKTCLKVYIHFTEGTILMLVGSNN
jgi:hypothetical protein